MKKFLTFCVITMLAGSAQAQSAFEVQQMYQRLNRLENDMGLLQRQLARGEALPPGVEPGIIGNAGQIGAEMARIDEEMRRMRGQLEQVAYEVEQTNKRIDLLQKDMEFRFQELNTSVPAQPQEEAEAEVEAPAIRDSQPVVTSEATDGSLKVPAEGEPMSARDLYNYAFKLLNQANYKSAINSFTQFTQNFADDPLVGNAWYWLGEAYYVQRDYVKAADSFRQGYQKLPDGPKAGDNLLKLAMSLSALEKTPEACVVLGQVKKKFASNSEMLRNKAQQEIGRLGCK